MTFLICNKAGFSGTNVFKNWFVTKVLITFFLDWFLLQFSTSIKKIQKPIYEYALLQYPKNKYFHYSYRLTSNRNNFFGSSWDNIHKKLNIKEQNEREFTNIREDIRTIKCIHEFVLSLVKRKKRRYYWGYRIFFCCIGVIS